MTESDQCERCRTGGRLCGPKQLPRDQPSERKSARQANRSSSTTPSDSKVDLKKPILNQLLPYIPENSTIEFAKNLMPELQGLLQDHKQNLSDEERMSEGIDELTINERQPSRSAPVQETDRGPYFESPVAQTYDNQSISNVLVTNTSTPTPPPIGEKNRNRGPSLAQGPNVPRPPQAPPAPVCPVVGRC